MENTKKPILSGGDGVDVVSAGDRNKATRPRVSLGLWRGRIGVRRRLLGTCQKPGVGGATIQIATRAIYKKTNNVFFSSFHNVIFTSVRGFFLKKRAPGCASILAAGTILGRGPGATGSFGSAFPGLAVDGR